MFIRICTRATRCNFQGVKKRGLTRLLYFYSAADFQNMGRLRDIFG